MARYIDADIPREKMQALYEHHIEMRNYSADGACSDCLNFIDNTPAADVAPKSEVDKARQDGYERGKREVVREIYRAFYNEIIEARNSNYEAIKERETKHKVNRYEDTFCYYCDGKIHALDGIFYFFDKLVKKYMGE